MTGHDLRFNLAAIAVAALLGAGITAVVVMTVPENPPLVSCTGQTGCTNGPRTSHQQLDPLAPTAPSRRDDARRVP